MNPFTVVSLFAGAGLMDLGFEQAGAEVVAAVEWDKRAVETWRHNRPGHEDRIICADIREVTPEALIAMGVFPGDLWAVIGGPPCQGFSVANGSRAHKNGNTGAWRDDPRNLLYREYLRLVTALRPQIFIMENVKPLFSTGVEQPGQPGPIMREVLTDFTQAGYRCTAQVLDAADYGVPQHRERVFVIGVRADLPGAIRYPVQTHGDKGSGYPYWRTVRWALAGLPEPGTMANHEQVPPPSPGTTREWLRKHPPMHPDKPSTSIVAHQESGHDNLLLAVPNHEVSEPPLACAYNPAWRKKHAPMALDSPASAIVANQDGSKNLLEGLHLVRPTPRQCARLQSVPDAYFFCGSKRATYRCIGNGVAVELARRIASTLMGKEPGREAGPYHPQMSLFDLLGG